MDAYETVGDPLDDLVAECIEAMEARGPSALEDLCARHPSQATVLRERIEALRSAGVLDPPEPAPERIGPYRVLEELGTGGMGAVYLAQQREPIRRQVAIKVIKPGMDSRQVLTRFEVERQAMALMNHPHIAKVLDCGLTERERPYFVMDYVAGQKITEYCDRRSLSTEDRLELFLPLCEAVQHAHQKGIIHRDLKPSNILVREESGRGLATIIDFGVAKAMGGALTEQTLHTEQGRILGTPEYMSPEQAGRGEGAVDTRSDVYSLGVVLYELLSGVLPFESETLRGSGYDKLKQVLQEQDPPTPSARVTGQDQASVTAAKARGLDVDGLRRRLKGDLDWITLRALEKDPARRYATPLELAADVRRHLANEAVLAGPPTLRYRLGKFVRRNRAAVLAGSAVMLAVFGGLVTSTWFYFDARAAQQQEKVALTQAQRDYDRMRVAVDAMLQQLADPRLTRVPGLEGVRTDLLKKAVGIYQEILDDHGEDDTVNVRKAGALSRLTDVLVLLGEGERAQLQAERAVALWRDCLAQRDTDHRRTGLVHALFQLAERELVQQRLERAGQLQAEALGHLDTLQARAEGESDGLERRLASAQNSAARQVGRTDPKRSVELLQAACERMERLTDRTRDVGDETLLALLQTNRARALMRAQQPAAALALCREIELRLLPVSERHPDNGKLTNQLIQVRLEIAVALMEGGRRAEAIPVLERVVEGYRSLIRRAPLMADYRYGMAGALNNLAACHRVYRRLDSAEAAQVESVELFESLHRQDPAQAEHAIGLVQSIHGRAQLALMRTLPSFGAAELPAWVEPELARAAEIAEEVRQRAPAAVDASRALITVLATQGEALAKTERPGPALAVYRRAIEVVRRMRERQPESILWASRWSDLHIARARIEEGKANHQAAADAWWQAVVGTGQVVDRSAGNRFARAMEPRLLRSCGEAALRAGDWTRLLAVVDRIDARREAEGAALRVAGLLAARAVAELDRSGQTAVEIEGADAGDLFAGRAFALLKRAAVAGSFDHGQASASEDLVGLRRDPGFARWLADLPLATTPEAPSGRSR